MSKGEGVTVETSGLAGRFAQSASMVWSKPGISLGVDECAGLFDRKRVVFAVLIKVLGWMLLVLGLIVWPLPIPFGALMVMVAISILLPRSKTFGRILAALLRRMGFLRRLIAQHKHRLPKNLAQSLEPMLQEPEVAQKSGPS